MKRFLLFLAFYPSFALADSNCPALFLHGVEPLTGKRIATLCKEGYAVGFSKQMKEPLWSSEHLTRTSVLNAQAFRAPQVFHRDTKIASGYQATLADYRKSGWRKGCLAPSGDMPNKSARRESFAFTNVIPQNELMSSRIWSKIEFRTRLEARTNGDVYAVTGPAFLEHKGTVGRNQIKIPSHIWKAVYDVNQGNGWSVLCENNSAPKCKKMPIFELEKKIGITVFG
ncbi:DNA/RNA non-specific endonuclease [Acetobacteraceae bacterium]|nr:DNA/RNA non-specific endonuclease [Acetobacteraceae bacterium]